jgi:CHRD domain
VAAAGLATALLVACGGSSPSRPPSTTTSQPAATSTTVRTTTLTAPLGGAETVPEPGAPAASGLARLTLDPDTGQVCWELTIEGVGSPTAAHLHTAPRGAVGPVTVALTAGATGPATGCAPVPPELAASVAANPAGFYVDVHADDFPSGAVRGQLGP